MFTGLIQTMGEILRLEPQPAGLRVEIKVLPTTHDAWVTPFVTGESVSVNGVCLTHIGDNGSATLMFDAIPETLSRTTLGATLAQSGIVNLERALRVGDPLGGHQVQGHIDATGSVLAVDDSDGYRIRIAVDPGDLEKGIEDVMSSVVAKGSITLNGVSLTVARLDHTARWFEVTLIPETLRQTTLGDLVPGNPVNLEADAVAKTIVQWLALHHDQLLANRAADSQ